MEERGLLAGDQNVQEVRGAAGEGLGGEWAYLPACCRVSAGVQGNSAGR